MKKKTAIITILYVVLCIAVCWGALQYVEKKDERLREEAKEKLDNFVKRHSKIVNVVYSGKKVNYEKAEIPEYNDYWWEDIGRVYKLTSQYKGWCLRIMEFHRGGLKVYKLYPYMVGYKYNFYDGYNSPSVQTAVDDAYKSDVRFRKKDFVSFLNIYLTEYGKLKSKRENEGEASDIRMDFYKG